MSEETESLLDIRFKYYDLLFKAWHIDDPYFHIIERLLDMALEGLKDECNDNVKFAYCWTCLELKNLDIVEDWFFHAFVRCVAPEQYDRIFEGEDL